LAINDDGIVVGGSYNDFIQRSDEVATIWLRRHAIDLNALIATDDPLQPFVQLDRALLINKRGQIIAEGKDSRQANPDETAFYLVTPAQ
jgi:hypothetical protein